MHAIWKLILSEIILFNFNYILTAKIIRALIALVICFMAYPVQTHAVVSGQCDLCHTMHNSQGGDSVNMPDTTGASIGWDASGDLAGGSVSGSPANNLLVTNCVGCHSSTTGQTIITLGDIRIPIVNNTVAPTENILAGGNFYWVGAGGDDNKGHNVYGISAADQNHLNGAPGDRGTCGDNTACHNTLAVSSNSQQKPGCQGCHFNVFHHEDNGQYRFLNGHQSSDHYVEGVEDDDWEQTVTASSHNFYKGYDGPVSTSAGATLAATKSISTFCSACHYNFHRRSDEFLTGIGDTGAWVRHPVDIGLPTTGEYGGYDPENSYDIDVPVAWEDPTAEDKGKPIVMCLSCHRPHGSSQPDMLRWDYENGCIAGTSNADCGCFTCHTDKNS